MRCRLGAAQQPFMPVLPGARTTMQEKAALRIVALGSSATAGAGAGASAEERGYPAVLEAELRRRLPDIDVRVLNKGVGGQSAYDMLLRMDADVIEEKPALVIWQTAVNDAVRDVGEDKLDKILRKGIRKARDAGIEMVLMDLPWLPRDGRYPKYDDYRAVLAKVAQQSEVAFFPRYEMMLGWVRSKRFSQQELVGMDGIRMIDNRYRCLAIRIADGLVWALTGTKPETAPEPKPLN